MNCPIDPEGSKVVVIPDEIDDLTAGGIIIPIETKRQEQRSVTQGTLVAIGPRAEVCWNKGDGRTETPAEVGDRVIFVQYGGTQFRWGKTKLQVLQDQDIVGKLLEEPPAVDLVHRQ